VKVKGFIGRISTKTLVSRGFSPVGAQARHRHRCDGGLIADVNGLANLALHQSAAGAIMSGRW